MTRYAQNLEREGTAMNERMYFTINESSARSAHDMMSMSDYTEGSATEAYRSQVNETYDIADKVAEKRPEEAERVYRLAERYSKKLAEYYNRESSIGMMCPSVLISGAGNFPVKKKERQVAAWDRNHQFYEQVQGIREKIKNILYGKSKNPGIVTIKIICDGLGITITEFFDTEEFRNAPQEIE